MTIRNGLFRLFSAAGFAAAVFHASLLTGANLALAADAPSASATAKEEVKTGTVTYVTKSTTGGVHLSVVVSSKSGDDPSEDGAAAAKDFKEKLAAQIQQPTEQKVVQKVLIKYTDNTAEVLDGEPGETYKIGDTVEVTKVNGKAKITVKPAQ